jgi:23S rRNA (adenine2503-C2)-methyltransferase
VNVIFSAVYIPGDADVLRTDEIEFPIKRKSGTICISSQVGCSVGCTFCFTGTQSVRRNLTPPEMIGQVMIALSSLGEFAKLSDEKTVQSIVFMGQGEPFYNYRNVVKTLDFLSDPEGLCFSRKKITISTSGVVPMIDKFSADPTLETIQLAISLHSIRDEVRDRLIPLNKQVGFIFTLELVQI